MAAVAVKALQWAEPLGHGGWGSRKTSSRKKVRLEPW